MTTGENAGGPAPEPRELRIGNAERESAARALDAHLEAGRLGVEEYADRAAAAANATVARELSALFVDLPAPHPQLPGTDVTPPAAPAPAQPSQTPERSGFAGWGPRIAAVTPIVALVLFFALNGVFAHAWLVFLLIPAVGGLVYGRERHEDRELERYRRHELRHRRRELHGRED